MFRRDSIFLSVLAALIVTPASFMLALYWLTDDPTLRPLAITQEKLVSAGMAEDRGTILTQVRMGDGGPLPMTRGDFEAAVNNAFDLYGLKSRFLYETVPDQDGVEITFKVGDTLIGAYPFRRVAEGIRPTAEAHRMAVSHAKRVAVSNRARMGVLERILAE